MMQAGRPSQWRLGRWAREAWDWCELLVVGALCLAVGVAWALVYGADGPETEAEREVGQ